MNLRDCVIESWEAAWGREGLWCQACRRSTPLAVLVVDLAGTAALHCESCASPLIVESPWYGAPSHSL